MENNAVDTVKNADDLEKAFIKIAEIYHERLHRLKKKILFERKYDEV